MVANKKEMVKNLVQVYFNTLSRYWEESDRVPTTAKENITYEEDTEELIDLFVASVVFAWKTRSMLQDNFVDGPNCSMIIRPYKELKGREVDWNDVWDRLIEAVEVGEEILNF
jgi:hypothetical protein